MEFVICVIQLQSQIWEIPNKDNKEKEENQKQMSRKKGTHKILKEQKKQQRSTNKQMTLDE